MTPSRQLGYTVIRCAGHPLPVRTGEYGGRGLRRGAAAATLCTEQMEHAWAQGHWDSGRNFIHLLRGRRRYILNPTSECSYAAPRVRTLI